MNREKKRNWKGVAKNNDIDKFRIGLLLFASLVLITIIVLFFTNKDQAWFAIIINILTSIFAALVCTAVLSFYEKKHQQVYGDPYGIKDSINEINDKLKIMDTDIQFVCTENEFDANIGFEQLFKSSRKATSICIYGRTLFNKQKEAIVSRFNKEGFESKCFFVDPNNPYIEIVSQKTGHSVDEIKSIITKNVSMLQEEYNKSTKKGTLSIYYLKLPPMQAVYIFDNVIAEFKYYSSSQQSPKNYVIIYRKDSKNKSIGWSLVEDSIKLEKESNCVYKSHN